MSKNSIDIWRRKLDHLRGAEAFASDPGEKFRLRQDIEEAKAKITELESEENELDKPSTESPQTRSRQFLDSLLYFKDYLPFIGFFATLIGYLRPGMAREVTAALLFFVVWILYLAFKAKKSFGTTRSVPGPTSLWQIVFGQLIPGTGKKLKRAGLVDILIIFDASTEGVVDSICHEYDRSISINRFKYTSDFNAHELKLYLDGSDAVYFFCTEAIDRNHRVYETVNDWAVDHSHKPVLAVNFLPADAPYHWTFNHIPKSAAVTGLWELLARATERAEQLRAQGETFRRIWAVSILIATIVTGGLIWSLYKSSGDAREARARESAVQALYDQQKKVTESGDVVSRADLYDLYGFWNRLVPVRKTIFDALESQQEKEKAAGAIAREALKGFAEYIEAELRRHQGVNSDSGSVTFWRKYEDKENKTVYFVEIVRSDGIAPTCFNGAFDPNMKEYPPIIGCAIEETSFVRWRDTLKDGDDASWSKDGDVNGHWTIAADGAQLVELPSTKCRYKATRHKRTELVCLGAISEDQGAPLKSGVCLSTDQAFRREEWTKHYLYQAVSIMQLLPDELLITDERLAQCRSSK